MSRINNSMSKILAIALVSIMLLSVSATVAFASSGKSTTHAASVPDISVIMGASGSKVSGASIYVDDELVGKTDSRGNFTFKHAPEAGNHTIKVTKKGINDVTMTADFAHTPVVVKAVQDYPGKHVEVGIKDKATGHGIEGVTIINDGYVIGTTGADGKLVMDNFPAGLYLIKLQKDGYKPTTTILIVASKISKQNYTLTPGASGEKKSGEHAATSH